MEPPQSQILEPPQPEILEPPQSGILESPQSEILDLALELFQFWLLPKFTPVISESFIQNSE